MKNAVLVALVLTCLACGDKPRDPRDYPISKDELIRNAPTADPHEATYRRYCISCHGSDGKGNGGITGADFTSATKSPLLARSDAELIASVRDGKRGQTGTMPAHRPVLKDEQIAGVVAYVRDHFAPKNAAVSNDTNTTARDANTTDSP